MSARVSVRGQLWSLADHPAVVLLVRRGWVDGWVWHAVVVDADAESDLRVGEEAMVRPEALGQRWTVKPLTGVTREVTT